jgi:formate dehydrogenase subunit gamma
MRMNVPVAWDENLAVELINERSGLEGAMLPILHALQEKFGYVDSRAVAIVANTLNVSRAEVFGTISFYHDFKRQPPLGRTIKLCRAEACQARGAEELAVHLERSEGIQIDGGYHNGVRVETAFCLGNCALGPNALFDGDIFGKLDPQSLGELYAAASRKAGARQ